MNDEQTKQFFRKWKRVWQPVVVAIGAAANVVRLVVAVIHGHS